MQVFNDYLCDKLKLLARDDQQLLSSVLRKYRHLFYGIKNSNPRCTSQVRHSIDTGDTRPIKKKLNRIPHSLKPVVESYRGYVRKRDY